MRYKGFKNLVGGCVFTIFALAATASAQNVNQEYRDWQSAQREAQRQYRDYQRNPNGDNYREWQRAQQQAQVQYNEYQRSTIGYNGRNNGSYNNRGMYRVYRNGSYYEVDQRGAELLRQAVNNGYRQGFAQGRSDRRYGRNSGYYSNSIYSNGAYGYQSYVARDQYQYYFQQGFQRGYEDGFNSRSRYGYQNGNTLNILGSVLNTILNLSQN